MGAIYNPSNRLNFVRITAGFHGSTDPRGEMLLKKRHMLIQEGVKFDIKGGLGGMDISDKDTSKARVNAQCLFEFEP